MGSRGRRWLSACCLAMAGILLPVGILLAWANQTFFDSRTFSERTVQLLDSPAVRRELAERITDQLALAGNQQAVDFGPAFQLAIDGAVNTEAFRSIFRTAVMRAHEQLLQGSRTGTLDLSDSVSIIANTLQLSQSGPSEAADERSLDATLTDVTQRAADLHVWQWKDLTAEGVAVSLAGAAVFAAGAIVLATDRRRAVRRLGWVVVADGVVIIALVVALVWFAGRLVSSEQLARAVQDGVEGWTADLRAVGMWLAGYGVVLAAAAATGARRVTPGATRATIARWIERQRETTAGTLALAVLFVIAGALLLASPAFWLRSAVLALGLWLVYFGVTEALSLVRARTPEPSSAETGGRRVSRSFVISAAIVAVLAVMSAGLVVTAGRAARHANAEGAPQCNGDPRCAICR